tara:strand:- start:506 stop:982 length:477 start_codon:yes stop_codon:yes gene_type:complete
MKQIFIIIIFNILFSETNLSLSAKLIKDDEVILINEKDKLSILLNENIKYTYKMGSEKYLSGMSQMDINKIEEVILYKSNAKKYGRICMAVPIAIGLLMDLAGSPHCSDRSSSQCVPGTVLGVIPAPYGWLIGRTAGYLLPEKNRYTISEAEWKLYTY